MPECLSVLIADDDRTAGQRLANAFLDRGFEVEVCEDVDQAVALVNGRHLDVVITELRIANQSGLAIVAATRALHSDTKTLVLTAYGSIQTAVVAVKLGATEFLNKPADIDEILEVLGLSKDKTTRSATILPQPDAVRWEHIVSVFEGTGKNVSKSARMLNMHRRTLQRMLTRGRPAL